jgi:hypothetical protein
MATSWVGFATESLVSPVTLAGSNVLPGALAQARLLVSGTQTTVAPRRAREGRRAQGEGRRACSSRGRASP